MKMKKTRRVHRRSIFSVPAAAVAAAFACVLPFSAPLQEANAAFPKAIQTTGGDKVRILFDGEPLDADAGAFISEGTTFVPFRALFERLGMTVVWDAAARTVVGTKDGHSITLRIGSSEALADGRLYSLPQPPVIADGRTFVPLRFVSEHAGALVDWDSGTRTVSVWTKDGRISPGEAAKAAYEAFVEAVNREDATATLRGVHPDSPLIGTLRKALDDAFARRDVETTLLSLTVEEAAADAAVLRVKESNRWMGGAYYIDNVAELKVTMRKGSGGAWLVYDSEILSRVWTSPFGAPSSGAADEKTEETAWNTIAGYLEALNREDLDAAVQYLHPDSPMAAATERTLRWLFGTYDLEHTLETVRVLEQSEDELYVYSVQVMSKKAGPKLEDVRTESVHTLRLAPHGRWKLYATVEGKREILSIPQ